MLSINNNSAAQSILQNLNSINNKMNTSYQELSTGNRVNSAANDPAGYAISQQMTSQVNGLNQATQNAQNGISMIQTATGAMNQIEQTLQTMSTLATEAANAGSTYSDRANLQLEMNALAQQINSTTNQTQYNGINLLTGQFGSSGQAGQTSLQLQIGANQGQNMSFNIAGTDAESLGVGQSQAIGVQTTGTPNVVDTPALAMGSFTSGATGSPVSATADFATNVTVTAGTGTLSGSYTLQYVAHTNSSGGVSGNIEVDLVNASGSVVASGTTSSTGATSVSIATGGVTYSVSLASASSLFTANAAGTFTATDSVTLATGSASITDNHVATDTFGLNPTSGGPATSGTYTSLETSASSISTAFANQYGGQELHLVYSAQTSSSGTASTVTVKLEDANNNVIGTQTLTGSNATGATTLNFVSGNDSISIGIAGASNVFTATSVGTYTQTDTLFVESNYASGQYTAGTSSAASGSVSGTSSAGDIAWNVSANNSTLAAGQQLKLAYNVTTNSAGSIVSGTLQLQDSNGDAIGAAVTLSASQIANGATGIVVGDNATNSVLTVNLNADSNLFSATGSGNYSQTDSFTLQGGSSTQPTQSNNWQAGSNINGISILTQKDAQAAISKIQNAISTLSSQQAQLGAVQNRLNYTVSNLQNSGLNLQNAESTITNTDMAQAYTQFSQQQVLSQVGISMLSQAQQQPSMILKLLQ